jgi:hypothetical protein
MAHGPLTFRERDVQAAVKAVKKAGEFVTAVDVKKDGTVRVHVGDPNIADAGKKPTLKRNPLDGL